MRGKLLGAWHRCVVDGRDHVVRDEEFGHGDRARTGRYRAVCGHVVVPGSMLLPPAPACHRCMSCVRAHDRLGQANQPTPSEHPRHRRPGFLRRLFARGESPAVLSPCLPRDMGVPERDGRTLIPAGTGRASTAPVPAGANAVRRTR